MKTTHWRNWFYSYTLKSGSRIVRIIKVMKVRRSVMQELMQKFNWWTISGVLNSWVNKWQVKSLLLSSVMDLICRIEVFNNKVDFVVNYVTRKKQRQECFYINDRCRHVRIVDFLGMPECQFTFIFIVWNASRLSLL